MSLYIIQLIGTDGGAYLPEQPLMKSAKQAAEQLMEVDGFANEKTNEAKFINGEGNDVSCEVAEMYVDLYIEHFQDKEFPSWVEAHAGLYIEDAQSEFKLSSSDNSEHSSYYMGSRI